MRDLFCGKLSAMTSPDNSPAVNSPALVPRGLDLTNQDNVAAYLQRLLPADRGKRSLNAWVCDRLLSEHSRRAYVRDLTAFVRHMERQGIDPLQVTGDDVRIYKEALRATGKSRTTIARVLSVLRGTYEQLGKKRLMAWELFATSRQSSRRAWRRTRRRASARRKQSNFCTVRTGLL
jgi:hypothetical protein